MTNLIIGAFFSAKPDPQRASKIHSGESWDDYTYLWRTTAKALGLPVVLIVDEEAQIDLSAESEFDDLVVHGPLHWTTNDERILAFEEYLSGVQCDDVLLTDTGDVLFKKNPFFFMTDEFSLYLGSDLETTRRVRDSFWLVQQLYLLNQELPANERFIPARCLPKLLAHPKLQQSSQFHWKVFRRFARVFHLLLPRTSGSIWESQIVNAGVVGGKRENVLNLLRSMCDVIRLPKSANDLNLNMAALNYVVWKEGFDYFSGPPLTNSFGSFDTTGPEHICHK